MEPTDPSATERRKLDRGAQLKAAVTEAHVVLTLLLTDDMRPLGLTVGEADVLTIACLNPEPLSPSEIAAQLNITGPGATGRLNALERRDLVSRVPNPDDGRRLTVHLTPAGRQLAENVIERKNAVIDRTLVDRLGPEPTDELVRRLTEVITLARQAMDRPLAER